MTVRIFCAAAIATIGFVPAVLAETPTNKADTQATVYLAKLHPLNAKVTKLDTTGEARF